VLASGVKQVIRLGIIAKQVFKHSPALTAWVFRIEVFCNILLRQELTVNVQRFRHDAKVLNIWQSTKNIHDL
jgi:hypothetical protein